MADINNVITEYNKLYKSIGRAVIHSLYPNDFEYYSISLELTTFDDHTVDFFVFPVLPKAISKTEAVRINVKKTFSAITVINSKSFTPSEIMIKGDFGRSFKILLDSGQSTVFKAFRFSRQNGVNNVADLDVSSVPIISNPFSVNIKTGYGCTKILQSIINKASGTDDKGRPFKLYLYNPALGESYLVVPSPNPLIFDQNDQQNNMIWSYTLNLTAISLVTGSKSRTATTSMTNLLKVDNIQKGLNSVNKLVKESLL